MAGLLYRVAAASRILRRSFSTQAVNATTPAPPTVLYSGIASGTCHPPVACSWYDLPGLVPYKTSWRWQQELLSRRIAPLPSEPPLQQGQPQQPQQHRDVVLCLEHPHVYTLGRGASESHLRFPPGTAISDIAEVHRVERGGKVTYHGPGQLVVYPVLQLERYRKDLHWYVTAIEEVLIQTLASFGLRATRQAGYPGVWIADRKIAQVGMNCSKWVTTHGFALNVDPDLSFFGHIVPCGIEDRAVTSMARELGGGASGAIPMASVRAVVADHFSEIFRATLAPGRSADPVADDD